MSERSGERRALSQSALEELWCPAWGAVMTDTKDIIFQFYLEIE